MIQVPAGVDGNAALTKLEKQYGVKLANGQDTLKGKKAVLVNFWFYN